MNIDELRALITLADQGRLSLLELKRPDFRLRLESTAHRAPVPPPHSAPVEPAHAVVGAPGFGFFCRHHPSRPAPMCDTGSQVKTGDLLALIRIDELYLPVVSEYTGVVRCLVEDGVLVGYGTPLFDIAA